MDPLRWKTIERLFLEALELRTADRGGNLEDAWSEDEDVVLEVRSMLDASEEKARLRIETRLGAITAGGECDSGDETNPSDT